MADIFRTGYELEHDCEVIEQVAGVFKIIPGYVDDKGQPTYLTYGTPNEEREATKVRLSVRGVVSSRDALKESVGSVIEELIKAEIKPITIDDIYKALVPDFKVHMYDRDNSEPLILHGRLL